MPPHPDLAPNTTTDVLEQAKAAERRAGELDDRIHRIEARCRLEDTDTELVSTVTEIKAQLTVLQWR